MLAKDNLRNIVSVFSGCGGFDIGFRSAGFVPIAAFDQDRVAVENYRDNIGPRAIVADLTKELPFSSQESVGVMLAGPPCQGFSTAGNRDPNDRRNDLLPLNAQLALRLKPQVVVVENVSGVQSGEHARHWTELEYRLRLAGYRTHSILVDGLMVGMAQRRRRWFLFAWRTRCEVNLSWPTARADRLDRVLSGVECQTSHNPKPLQEGSRLHKIARRIGPGQKLCNVRGGLRSVHTWHIPEVFGRTTAAECALLEAVMRIRRAERRRDRGDADPVTPKRLKREFGNRVEALIHSLLIKGYLRQLGRYVDLVHTFNGKFRRVRWEDVSCTVDTRFGDPHLFLHPNEHRPFTVREAARIQGFPDAYNFRGSERDHFRLIGNAVPPQMAAGAAMIARRLLGI